MAAPIGIGLAVLPDAAESYTQRPVTGATLGGFADVVNYLGGWRNLRVTTKTFDHPVSGSGVTPTLASQVYRIRHRVDIDTTHLFVWFTYYGLESTFAVAATLCDPDDETNPWDDGCAWSFAGGTLVTRPYTIWGRGIVPDVAHTGFVPLNTSTATAYPRPMYVYNGAGPGAPAALALADRDVVVKLTVTDGRIYEAGVMDLYLESR